MDADFLDQLVPDPSFRQREEVDQTGRVVLELGGELDMFVTPKLAARFHELAEEGTRDVVVDLHDARFIDTTVLEAFVNAQRELEEREHALAVVADHPYAQRTFELTGLRETLRVSDTRDEAFARLGS